MKRVALFGGSFNPPHVGHLLTATAVKAVGLVDEVALAPAFHHPFDKPLAPFKARMLLCRKLVEGFPGISVMRAEEFNPTGYTVDLLEWLQVYVTSTPTKYSVIVGTDIITDVLTKWHNPKRLFELANLIVVGRSGYPMPDVELPPGTRCLFPMPEVSSTDVRERIAKGEDISDLVPPGVSKEIKRLKLYKGSST